MRDEVKFRGRVAVFNRMVFSNNFAGSFLSGNLEAGFRTC
jgi:hypothetical protein